jgi:uncharacterized protein YndB with AHSA1/START domain
MREFHGRAATRIESEPHIVFDLITDIGRLPEWNVAIEDVQDQPAVLEQGAQWTVKMHPPHAPSWGSVSRVEALDGGHLGFAYETRNTDGNPSYTKWAWDIVRAGEGADIAVSWDVYLETLDRRFLAGPIRRRQLRKEVPASLARLATLVGSRSAQTAPPT